MIAERLLPGFTHHYGTPYKQLTYLSGEISQKLHQSKLTTFGSIPGHKMGSAGLGQAKAKRQRSSLLTLSTEVNLSFHLYCSKHNPGARAVAGEISALIEEEQRRKNVRLPSLMWTDNPDNLDKCEHMLVHLDSRTWTPGEDSIAFARELCHAMRLGVHRLLAHEVPGARMDDEPRCGCSFDQLLEETPSYLQKAGIYNGVRALQTSECS